VDSLTWPSYQAFILCTLCKGHIGNESHGGTSIRAENLLRVTSHLHYNNERVILYRSKQFLIQHLLHVIVTLYAATDVWDIDGSPPTICPILTCHSCSITHVSISQCMTVVSCLWSQKLVQNLKIITLYIRTWIMNVHPDQYISVSQLVCCNILNLNVFLHM